MLTAALRTPAAVGVNVTEIVQLPPAATLDPQVLVWAKSPLFVPVIAILVMLSAALRGLFNVIVWAALVVPTFWLANVRLDGESDACATAVPVPLNPAVCGDPVALSVMLTAALRTPAAVGVNVTEIVQLPPAATLDPQVLVWAKSPLFVPVIAMLVMLRVAVPGLLNVIVWAALVVATFWLANVRLDGESDTCATAVPVPLNPAVCGDPVALSVMLTAALRTPAAVGVNVTEIVQLPPAATLDPQVLVWA